jgi:hypothetical protein
MSNDGPQMDVDQNLFDARENSPASMRVIAEELRSQLDGLLGGGGKPNSDAISGCGLSGAEIGTWNDAMIFAGTVGSSAAGTKFAEVYTKFVNAYKDVVEAIETSADNHDRARRTNEGG